MIARKKERSHNCGNSNIDFRTKRDKEAITLFQPWMESRKFGTMGYSGFNLTSDQNKNIMSVTKSINTLKDLNFERPNPKTYFTAKFYEMKEISKTIKKLNLNDTERLAQLDETFKGKDKYTGDSMMIATNAKKKRKKELSLEKNKIQSKCYPKHSYKA